jgi:hypothetical protein
MTYLIKKCFRYAHAFLVDTGSGVGEMSGHEKCVNTVDYKTTRPFAIVTASEDYSSRLYPGPPFKNKDIINKVNLR